MKTHTPRQPLVERLEDRRMLAGDVTFDSRGLINHLPSGGINLNAVNYWSTQQPFNDALKRGKGWKSNTAAAIPLRTDGYPSGLASGQTATAMVFKDAASGRFPTGTYVLEWDGDGELALRDYGGNKTATESDGRIDLNVPSSNGGLSVTINRTNAANPVRNVRLWLPGQRNAGVFNSSFTSRLANYEVLRVMDWNVTNNNADTAWGDRALPGDAFYGTHGVPYEDMVRLANQLDKDLWITVPAETIDGDLVTRDQYARKLAQGLRYGFRSNGEPYTSATSSPVHPPLESGRNVWIEYSNETWNGIFAQSDYVLGKAGGVASQKAATSGKLSRDLFTTFDDYFPNDRLVKVVAGQAANEYVLSQGLTAMPAKGTRGAPDVASVSYYYTNGSPKVVQYVNDRLNANGGSLTSADKTEVFRQIDALMDATAVKWGKNADAARAYGIPLVAYEGNQHLDAQQIPTAQQNANLVSTLAALTRDGRQYTAYSRALDLWTAKGGKTAVGFSDVGPWGKSGQWGHLEYQDQPASAAPLFHGLQDWLSSHSGGFGFSSPAAVTPVSALTVRAQLRAAATAGPVATAVEPVAPSSSASASRVASPFSGGRAIAFADVVDDDPSAASRLIEWSAGPAA